MFPYNITQIVLLKLGKFNQFENMSTQEQTVFVTSLCNIIRDQVIDQIVSGKIPEEWDGHELRRLLSQNFQESANMSRNVMIGKRLKDYKNSFIINNL